MARNYKKAIAISDCCWQARFNCQDFYIKLQEMMKASCEKHWFGKVIAYIYVIEFQKRGLPHAYILLILNSESKIHSVKK